MTQAKDLRPGVTVLTICGIKTVARSTEMRKPTMRRVAFADGDFLICRADRDFTIIVDRKVDN